MIYTMIFTDEEIAMIAEQTRAYPTRVRMRSALRREFNRKDDLLRSILAKMTICNNYQGRRDL